MFALDLLDIFSTNRKAVQAVLRRELALLVDLYVPPAAEVVIDGSDGRPLREWRRMPS